MADIPSGNNQAAESTSAAFEKTKLGIWAFLATELMLFGGLFTAYSVYRIRYQALFHEQHLHLNRTLGAVNTVVLICSSLSVAIGIAAIKAGKQAVLKLCLAITLVLASSFLFIKYLEYSEHIRQGDLPSTNLFFSLYYMMTGLHAIHVMAGMAALTTMLIMTDRGAFSKEYSTPVEITGIYWHFVDLVWIYLFPLLYLIG